MNEFVFYFTPVMVTFVLMFCLQRTSLVGGEISFNLKRSVRKLNVLECFVVGIPMMILPACQYGTSADYWGYCDIYNGIENFNKDFLWKFINDSFLTLELSFQSVYVFSVIVMVFLYLCVFSKETEYPMFSLFIFVCVGWYVYYVFCVLRQGIALGIVLFAFRYVQQRQFWRYCFCIVVAFGFHQSAFLALPMYWLYWYVPNYKLLMGLTGFIILFRPFIGITVRYLASLTRYGGVYLNPEYDKGLGLGMMVVVHVVILFCGILFRPKKNRKYEFYLTCEFVALWLSLLADFLPLCDRITIYYHVFSVLFIPSIARQIKDGFTKNAFVCSVMVCYMLLFTKLWIHTLTYVHGSPLISDYQWFFGMW